MHHADWLASMLHGRGDVSDWNNTLKLGFDPGEEAYPAWLQAQVRSNPTRPLLCCCSSKQYHRTLIAGCAFKPAVTAAGPQPVGIQFSELAWSEVSSAQRMHATSRTRQRCGIMCVIPP